MRSEPIYQRRNIKSLFGVTFGDNTVFAIMGALSVTQLSKEKQQKTCLVLIFSWPAMLVMLVGYLMVRR